MQRLISALVILLWTGGAIAGQNGDPLRSTSRIAVEGRISIIRLAPGFTTTVRLTEPVSSVVVGDSSLIHAEHSPDEPQLVFVRLATRTVAETNLLITTTSGRQFPLIMKSGGETDREDSAVDLLVLCRPTGTSFIEETYSTSLIAETLAIGSTPLHEESLKPDLIGGDLIAQLLERQRRSPIPKVQGDRLQVAIGDVVDRNSRFVVLFSVVNSTNEPVELMSPQVQLAGQAKSGTFKQSSRWTTVEQIPVTEFRLDRRKLDPGNRTDGFVVFERPPLKQSNESLLLQIAEAAMVDKPVLVPIRFSVSSK